MNLNDGILAGVPPHRVARLRRQGERYFADGLRDLGADRRRAIMAVCVIEWATATADAVIETHDRIVGRTWRDRLSVRTSGARACRGRSADPPACQMVASLSGLLPLLPQQAPDGPAAARVHRFHGNFPTARWLIDAVIPIAVADMAAMQLARHSAE